MHEELRQFTERLRAPVARGIRAGHKGVNREKGILEGVAVITEGEARGHGFAIDEDFVQDVVSAGAAAPGGIKSRFGHPNASSNALGTFLGREQRFYLDRRDGKAIARADLHLSETAKKSPKGDLHEYTLDLAEHEPDMFGTSIVFTWSNMYKRDKDGKKVYAYDEDGEWNPAFSKLRDQLPVPVLNELRADDVVDQPAANEGGLFSESLYSDGVAAQMTALLDEHPALLEFLAQNAELDDFLRSNEVIGPFLARYAEYREERAGECNHNHTEEPMADETKTEKTPEQLASENDAALTAAKAAGVKAARQEMAALSAAFPNDHKYAADAFAAGKSVQEAKADYCDKLSAENAELRAKLAAKPEPKPDEGVRPDDADDLGDDTPIQFGGEPVAGLSALKQRREAAITAELEAARADGKQLTRGQALARVSQVDPSLGLTEAELAAE
jgi:hypothetical protein